MKRLLVDVSIGHPKAVIVAMLLLTVLALVQFPRIAIDTDPENMLPANEPVRVFHDAVKEAFDLSDLIVVGIVREEGAFNPATLSRVATLTDHILDIPGVVTDDVIALSVVDDITTESDGSLRVAPLMESPPEDLAGAEALLARIRANPLYRGKLASDDGKAITIFVPIESKDLAHEIGGAIRAEIDATTGDETIHLAGIPIAEDTFGIEMFKQMAFSAPIAFLMIFVLMLVFFRSPRLVAGPMIVAMVSVTWTMGLLIGLGFTVHIMSSMIPIFLIPIAVLDSIHLLTEFHERYSRTRERERALREAVDELYRPMLFTSLTTMVGFASLLLAPIPPVQVFGAFVAFGILCAWILSMTLILSIATLMPEKALQSFGKNDESHGVIASSMRALRAVSWRHQRLIPALTAVLVLAAAAGLPKIVVNDNPVKWFRAGNPLRIADDELNAHLAGTYVSYLAVTAPEADGMKDPETMRYIERLQEELAAEPNVGGSSSIADVVKKVRAELFDSSEESRIPENRDEIAQYLFLYEIAGGDPGDLFKFITPDAERANIWVQMRAGENQAVTEVVERIRAFAATEAPEGVTTAWAGLPYINVEWQRQMVTGMGKALLGSFVVVLCMMTLLFRSLRLGLLSMVPLTATIVVAYGIIGHVGKPYDMPIAVLSSLSLGLSIDFAIHFLQRAREGYAATGAIAPTLDGLFEAPARAIGRNVVVIAVGFVPMFFADLIPYVTVSVFFFTIMLISGVATLLTLPSILSLSGGSYLRPYGQRKVSP